MKNQLLSGSLVALVMALAVPALAAPPAVPTGPLEMNLTKKPVIFDHAQHSKLECGACHHQVAGKENYQKCATAGCHDVLNPKDKTSRCYYRIAHNRKVADPYHTCLSCHAEVVKQLPDKKKAMTSCVGSSCHPKS